ncbi:MAG: hypothetical protein Greene041662_343 [Candidatus Peregrinibacteria bacterium Greene0416_62]|nr:MAG: hypothetical protein Greene041662_343 [Candidatus Peregrinibacteria bacterium Greene0416_62]TSD00292.1 MAG: hypothetical protein Greene101449_226 [Candidatus Peregrinibacteria bacterium Greene1014_49]
MLTIEQCRTYLKETALTDEQVERLRDSLYAVTQTVLAPYFTSPDTDDE